MTTLGVEFGSEGVSKTAQVADSERYYDRTVPAKVIPRKRNMNNVFRCADVIDDQIVNTISSHASAIRIRDSETSFQTTTASESCRVQ
jgi:hypothetical protein